MKFLKKVGKQFKKNSIANGVAENIYIQSEASTQSIAAISDAVFKNSLIMIDIEGSEFDLLNEKIF
ncbi:hypothetical protein [Comamonas aquatica]|uniref:hypothetical protein n=1 Tax=Comamonas aquatica TaxID=225991 RepID=UPI001F1A0F0B|nr:hypothetical protein [Comamonas aquatica]